MGSLDNKLYCFSNTAGVEWSYTTAGEVHSSPAVADLDNDGRLEILIGSDDFRL